MQSTTIDPVSLAVALAGVLLSPTLADAVGPYAVILLMSTVGAGWALGRRKEGTRLSAARYILLLNGTAVAVTAPLAAVTAWALGAGSEQWLLAPVALLVGAVGHDWQTVGRWFLVRVGRIFERRTGTEDAP